MIKPEDDHYIGKLIGNTGQPNNLTVALRDSFSARRGEFIRVAHQERRSEAAADVLGRIVSLSRSNIMFNEALGEGISEVEVLPSTKISVVLHNNWDNFLSNKIIHLIEANNLSLI